MKTHNEVGDISLELISTIYTKKTLKISDEHD